MENTKTEQMPALVELLKGFDNELGCLEGMTCEIKIKCNQLLRLDEPSNEKSNEKSSEEIRANDKISELKKQLVRLRTSNERLKGIQVHLNKIYN